MGAPEEPLVLVSGFGSFEAIGTNPSGEIARALAAAPPPGTRVRSAVLPVSFERAPRMWDAELGTVLGTIRPALLLAIGVDSKGQGFRLERCGRPTLKDVPRVDVDGRSAREFSRPGPHLESQVDLDRLLPALRARGVADARLSDSAGGYVCERIYHHVLTRAHEHGVPGLFLHVPQLHLTPLARQIEVAGWVIEETLALLG